MDNPRIWSSTKIRPVLQPLHGSGFPNAGSTYPPSLVIAQIVELQRFPPYSQPVKILSIFLLYRHSIGFFPSHQRPGSTHHLGSQGDRRLLDTPPVYQISNPLRSWIRFLSHMANHRHGPLYKEGAQIAIPVFGDSPQSGLPSRTRLPGHEPNPGGEFSAIAKKLGIPDSRHHRSRRDGPYPGNLRKALCSFFLRKSGYPLVALRQALVQAE